MKQTKVVLLILIVIIVLLGVAKFQSRSSTDNQPRETSPAGQPTIPVTFVTPGLPSENTEPRFVMVSVDNQNLSVEVARTEEEITQGLSNRTSLGSDGMLFVIDPPRIPSFWMKGMNFPLDIIWIRNGKVINIDSDVPAFMQQAVNPPLYQPSSSVDHVLELPAGVAKTLGFKVGSTFTVTIP